MPASDRKAAIVKAALPLFARQGFARTTTKDLARAAGVSEPLLYRHFPSKEALYLEIQNHTCRDTDTISRQLAELPPSTATLVHLVYYLVRALLLGQPTGPIDWDTRHRLMVTSFLEDGEFARLLYRNRFDDYCLRIEACLDVATASGDAVASPVSAANRARLAHHAAAYVALAQLPDKAVVEYQAEPRELLDQTMWFVLRGMGLTDRTIRRHYRPAQLEKFFADAP